MSISQQKNEHKWLGFPFFSIKCALRHWRVHSRNARPLATAQVLHSSTIDRTCLKESHETKQAEDIPEANSAPEGQQRACLPPLSAGQPSHTTCLCSSKKKRVCSCLHDDLDPVLFSGAWHSECSQRRMQRRRNNRCTSPSRMLCFLHGLQACHTERMRVLKVPLDHYCSCIWSDL